MPAVAVWVPNRAGITAALSAGAGVDYGDRVATPTIRADVPLAVLRDVIQPFPTFSEIYVATLKALRGQIKESP